MFADPIKNLKALGLREDMIVADLGAGTGFYTIAAAKLVPNGKVYAIEILKDYVATVKNKAREAHLSNVECFWGNVEQIGGTKIKDSVVDVVITSNVFFQIEYKDKFIKEVSRILKTDGRVLFVDLSPISFTLNIDREKIVSKDDALKMFMENGFDFIKDVDVGEHHYGMILKKQ